MSLFTHSDQDDELRISSIFTRAPVCIAGGSDIFSRFLLLLSFSPASMVSLLPRAPSLAFLAKSASSQRPPAPSMSSPFSAASVAAGSEAAAGTRKLPVLLFDVMDTLVRDPFYHHIPGFFQFRTYRGSSRLLICAVCRVGWIKVLPTILLPFVLMSMKELLESKHPTAWSEFEKGLIDENEMAKKFFKDGRSFDLQGLKECMVRAYEYIDGVEDILCCLKKNNYEMHAFTNYPVWYQLIEDKLKLSKYLSWTFCSCRTGKRKPSPEFYLQAADQLNVDPASCVFIDDRMINIEAALSVGMVGLQFKSAEALQKDLCALGVELSPLVCEGEAQVQ
ncbi:Flavin mononucleotide hydrolase 1, chloroplatic [Zea mays]|uniref:Flavin mononucleotide hydrolase 1, chloroplatic n=1 Tax=Zea mays TaxID=4577 RepID=A0A3L6F6T4_MAIZE|nr:Flavin mononucleotide hydrolase 1, chloroplatic [Zea mays]